MSTFKVKLKQTQVTLFWFSLADSHVKSMCKGSGVYKSAVP